MIKIDIDETIVNNFYNGVKEYIGKHLFILNPEKDYFTDEKIEEIIKCKIVNTVHKKSSTFSFCSSSVSEK